MLDRKSVTNMKSWACGGPLLKRTRRLTLKHTPRGVLYAEAHTEPSFFTLKHMGFTLKHMAPWEAGVCLIVKDTKR